MPTPPAKAATGAGKKGFMAWYAGHKNEALLGGAGIVVAIALYVKSKNAAAASGTSSTATPSSTVMPGTTAPSTYGGGGGDMSGFGDTLAELQQEIAALSPNSGGSSTSTAVSGSWGGGSGQSFDPVAAGSTIPSGVQLFWEVAPGVFDPYSSGVPSGTQLYVMPNPNQPTGLQQGNAGGGPPTTVPK